MRLLKTNMNRAAIIILLLAGAAGAQGAPSLTVGDVTYENVTLKKEYPRSFFIQHDGGTAFIERSKLSDAQIADLLQSAGDGKSAAAQEPAEPETKTDKAEIEYVHPSPDSLTSDEQRKFFEACGKADTATIMAMLKEDPSLAKVTIKGQGYRRIMPQMVGEERTPMRQEPAEATCDALQWLVDKSEKTPERIEAIKALVEAGADPARTTSEAGCNMARNTVSRPSMLTVEELDYLLSKGANPDFGFCVASYPPAGLLAIEFATTQDAAKKETARKYLETFIARGASVEATGSPSFAMRAPTEEGKWKDATLYCAADVAKVATDPELDAILAKAEK